MTIGEFKKIKMFLSRHESYQITEKFIKFNNTYNVDYLSVWEENGIVGFNDIDNEIYGQDESGIKGFIMNSAELQITKNNIAIKFRDGDVVINSIL